MQSSGPNPTDNRRGSSIFAASDQGDASGPYGRPAYLYGQQDGSSNLLVDFPDRNMMDVDDVHMEDPQAGGYENYGSNPTGNSSAFSGPMPSGSGNRRGSDFMSGAVMSSGAGGVNPPRLGEAARMQELANSQDLPGGPNHRPLVGGFAAAAYEAAKAHHYSMKRDTPSDGSAIPRDRPPPSI